MKQFSQALILTPHRDYAQAMRASLLELGGAECRVDVELDALRAMQLVPQPYELILIDMSLNAMDGMQLLLLLRHQAPASKFVIVSDVGDEKFRALAYQNGADLFLERPRSPEAFHAAAEALAGLLETTPAEQPSADELDGALVHITDMIETCCLSGDSVLLQVRSLRERGEIFIYRGEVFHAQYPGKSGDEAFHEIAHWDSGLVRIKTQTIMHLPPRTIEMPYVELLEKVREERSEPESWTQSELFEVVDPDAADAPVPEVVLEAPPLAEGEPASPSDGPKLLAPGEGQTSLPPLIAHWKVDLMGNLTEGFQVAQPDRCAFITYFIYRKLADVAVTLEVDYFNELTLWGEHLQQVLRADNLGVRHAVFDATCSEDREREQYLDWCREQSL